MGCLSQKVVILEPSVLETGEGMPGSSIYNNNITYKNEQSSSFEFQKLFKTFDGISDLHPEQILELKTFIHENIKRIKFFNIKNLSPQLMYFDMMKAKAGIANALINAKDNRAKYNLHNKTLQLAKYTICGGKVDSRRERPEPHDKHEPIISGSGSTPERSDPNPHSPATPERRAVAIDTQHIICNKARKIILEQGYCTDIYDKKGVLIYNNDNIYINNHTGDITTKTPSSGGAGQPRVWLKTFRKNDETVQ